jgi:AcrR family transcriptional regulator
VPSGKSSANDTRNAILSAAVAILHEHGAGALTVRSVAAAAGCSTTGVYTWFGGKNGLVEAIFVDGFVRFAESLATVRTRRQRDAHVLAMAHAYRDWARANPTHYVVMFGGAVPDFRPSAEARDTARATFDSLVEAVEALAAERDLDGSPRDVAHHLWAGMHGYVSLEIAGMDMHDSEAQRRAVFADGLRRLMHGCVR